jgi:hypothetical protein
MIRPGCNPAATPERDLIGDVGSLPPFPWCLAGAEKHVVPRARAQRILELILKKKAP